MTEKFTHIDDDLLAKYLLNEATEVEQLQVEEWANLHQDNAKYLADLKTILTVSQININNELNEVDALGRLNNRLENVKKRKIYLNLLRIAAILFVLIGLVFILFTNPFKNEVSFKTAQNTSKEELPDGSTIFLNKYSSVSYTGGFFAKTRDVKLTGEAFFEVEHDKSKPFIISINNVKITVVGTAFNVKSYGKETMIIVENGVVKVSNRLDSVRLTAGEKVFVKEKDTKLNKGENHGKLYNYYYTHEIICDKTPLSELIPLLNEKFHSNIVFVNPELKNLQITTTFKNETLKEILKVIEATFKIQVIYGADTIKLK